MGTRVRRELAGKRVLVVGLARSGRAAVDLLLGVGSKVVAADRRSEAELDLSSVDWRERGVELVLGEHPRGLLNGIDLVVTNQRDHDLAVLLQRDPGGGSPCPPASPAP